MTLRAMALVGLLCACEGDDPVEGGRADTILALSGDATTGQGTYDAVCAPCHAVDGSGGIGSNIQDRDVTVFVDAILNGRTGMISYADDFTDQEIADIAAHGESL